MRTRARTHMCTGARAFTRVRMHKYMHTNVHTHMHTHTHTEDSSLGDG